MESELGLAGSGMQRGKAKAAKPPKREVQEIHAKRVKGGYKVVNHHNPPHPPQEHGGIKTKEELMAHMDEHMPEPEGAGEAAAGGGEGAQEEAVGE